jgi:ribosomal protein L7/L12
MDISKDELLRLVSGEQAFDYVCAQNAVLAAQVRDYRARLDYQAGLLAAEQLRHAKLVEKQAAEYNVMAAALRKEIAARTDAVETAQRDTDYWRGEAEKARAVINGSGPVRVMADGAIGAAVAEFTCGSRNKIAMIKSLRDATGIGLKEAKDICEQIIAAMDHAVAVYKEDSE